MKVFRTVDEMSAFSSSLKEQSRSIGLVPTMGALHTGHASLIEKAKSLADSTIVSIYVNPAQFSPEEDLEAYPRSLDADLAICQSLGAEAVFAPANLYSSTHSTYVEETVLSQELCGQSRPSHFKGVTTIVLKLLNIVQPHVAVFGRKDAQQARIIIRMIDDLNLPTTVHLAPTVRESDGLAVSSRNRYLSPSERECAPHIYSALKAAKDLVATGVISSSELTATIRSHLDSARPPVSVEYLEIVTDPDLRPIARVSGNVIIAIAARIGKTRLIDNIELESNTD
jgi:pantoate--beta-alanine ligase